MKKVNRSIVAVAICCLLTLGVSPAAHAVDLTMAFGAGQSIAAIAPQYCQVQATHGSSQVLTGSVVITHGGSDSAVISVSCLGTAITGSFPSITVNGVGVSNVAFPQTVTSTASGVWVVQIGSLGAFTIIAQ